ncbi:MAG: stalk domain-containing protein [Oscillospiraceae bacterium]
MKKLSRWLAMFMAICLLVTSALAAPGATQAESKFVQKTLTYQDLEISVDGNKVDLMDVSGKTVAPLILDGTVYLPVRAVSETLNYDVAWDDATSTITISAKTEAAEASKPVQSAAAPKSGTVEATLCYRDIGIVVNGKRVTLTEEPFAIDGTTYLPLKTLTSILGCEINWDSAANTVSIVSAENTVLKAGAGIGKMVFPQEYFENVKEDGSISYEDGFNGTVHTFQGAKGEIVDDLCTRVLLLEDTVRVAIVALEIAQAPDDQVAYTKQIVSEICGVDPANVWVHTTHQFGFMHRPSDAAKAAIYDEAMKKAATEAATQAMASFQPAVMGVGTGDCYVSANKNITAPEEIGGGPYYGPGSTLETNTTMTILRFESAQTGDLIGFFMSYGTKPSALCTTGKTVGNRQVNTEVTGQASKWMEEEYGVPCMFCMPAAGDQYPRETAMYYGLNENGEWKVIDIGFDEGIKIVDRLGAEMGADAIRIAQDIECSDNNADISIAATSFTYPNKSGDGEIGIAVDAITLGDIAFVGFKQEMDCATEQQIWEASPYETTLLVSFLNGDGKYLGHKEAYDFNNGIGTWETARSAFAVGAAEKFVEVASDLLNKLYTGESVATGDTGSGSGGQQVISNGTIEFGGISWYVLDVKDGKKLVMSEKVLEMRAYNDDDEPFTWETCDLRAYLNGEFLEKTFTAEERAKIVEVTNKNNSNPRYAISGGNDTTDKVFLLSLEEAELYLQGFGELLKAQTDAGESVWWHLRSPGEAVNVAASVSAGGLIDYHGVSDSVSIPVGGVRPVMWLDLG